MRVVRITLAGLLAVGVIACDADTTVSGSTSASNDDHSYSMKDGEAYGYEHGLSEDDKKAGKASPDISMFRYLGEDKGVYRLITSAGSSTLEISCAKPCENIKMFDISDPDDISYHVFTSDSVMGAALMDAESGKLEVSQSAIAEVAAAKSSNGD